MKLFKPEDFHPKCQDTIDYIGQMEMAEIANAKLKEWLDAAPTVYGQGIGAMKSADWNMNGPEFERYKHTHSAKLVCIEEIKKECKHEPEPRYFIDGTFSGNALCKNCGVELVAEWKVR